MNARPDPVLFLAVTPSMRQRIEATIEHLVALLDTIDGDPDLEDGDDAEPEPLEPYLADAASDLEDDPGESGIGDGGGLAEQWLFDRPAGQRCRGGSCFIPTPHESPIMNRRRSGGTADRPISDYQPS